MHMRVVCRPAEPNVMVTVHRKAKYAVKHLQLCHRTCRRMHMPARFYYYVSRQTSDYLRRGASYSATRGATSARHELEHVGGNRTIEPWSEAELDRVGRTR